MKTVPLLWLLALVTGALIPVQAAANAALSRSLQSNVGFAALILFVVAAGSTLLALGLLRSGIVFVARPKPGAMVRHLLSGGYALPCDQRDRSGRGDGTPLGGQCGAR